MLSNIFKSSGSPVNSKSTRVKEWQVAIAWTNKLLLFNCLGSKHSSEKKKASAGITEYKSNPSFVNVPVWNQNV